MKNFLILSVTCLLAGCGLSPHQIDTGKITSINIIDRNGMSETINSKERLNAFENTNFLAPQPYQKVLRVYEREKNGDAHSCITSYHPNGQVKQYLEAVNNRAFGVYREWYLNGTNKVDAYVIGGLADINTQAEQSWLFEGTNRAWDEEGQLIAEIRYVKGELQGESIYYHPNGEIWKTSPYDKNRLNGCVKIFLDNGQLLQTISYKEGVKEGLSYRYWNANHIAYQERYENGLLMEAYYQDEMGASLASIQSGKGYRAIFGKNELNELHEYQGGVQEGCVKVFDERRHLISLYSVKHGEKEGEETDFFPHSTQPKLLLTWHNGVLQGPVKTWFENGQLESQREMCNNQKHGLLTAWYKNGALMLIEDYENDKLVKGEYFRLGERTPLTQVEKGKGVATLFNAEGGFSRKIFYQEGKPVE